jgi:hypothetical protein
MLIFLSVIQVYDNNIQGDDNYQELQKNILKNLLKFKVMLIQNDYNYQEQKNN